MSDDFAVILTETIFLIIGVVCVLWPYKIQEFVIKMFALGQVTSSPFLNWIKSRSYILSLRIIGVLAIGIAFTGSVMIDNPRREIIIEGPTNVSASKECSGYFGQKPMTVLNKGDQVQVLSFGAQILKACAVFKVKLADGRAGYITSGDNFRAIEFFNDNLFAVIEDSTNVMSRPDSMGAPGNSVLAVLHKGEKALAISEINGVGAYYYNIMLDDGRCGYLKGDDKFSLVEEKD